MVSRWGIIRNNVAFHHLQEGGRGTLFTLSHALLCALLTALLVHLLQGVRASATNKTLLALALTLHAIASASSGADTLLRVAGTYLELAILAIKAFVACTFSIVAYTRTVAIFVASTDLASVARIQIGAGALARGAGAYPTAVVGARWWRRAIKSCVAIEAFTLASFNALTDISAAAIVRTTEC